MTYIGFDLSLTETGWCVIPHLDEIRAGVLKPKLREEDRLEWFFDQFKGFIWPSLGAICAVEGPAFARTFQAHQMGELHGTFKLAHAMYGSGPLCIYSPGQVKQFATGKGNAKKDEMLLAVYKKWGFETNNHNIADAYAIAQLCKAHNEYLGGGLRPDELLAYERGVLDRIINPVKKTRKQKEPV